MKAVNFLNSNISFANLKAWLLGKTWLYCIYLTSKVNENLYKLVLTELNELLNVKYLLQL